MHDDAASVRDAFSAGADGYLVKRTPGEHLIGAIRTVLSNERFIDPGGRYLDGYVWGRLAVPEAP